MKKNLLSTKYRYENSNSENTQIRIGLETEQNIIKNNDRTVILNLSEQFYKEKNKCNQYKIFGKLRMIFRNLYSGTTEYNYLKSKLSYVKNTTNWEGYLPYNEFAFRRNDIYHETIVKEIVDDLDDFNGFEITTIGNNAHTNITNLTAPYHNWNIYLTYVYTGDSASTITYTLTGNTYLTFLSGDGIVFRVEETINSYVLTSPVQHGMNQGDYIIISGNPYYINSIGNNIYNSEKYVINLKKSQFSGLTLNTLITGKRCTDIKNINGTTSLYYVHKHKTLTDYNQCEIDNLGFESPIFEDERKVIFKNSSGVFDTIVERNRMESILYNFTDNFILSGLTNNLNFTPNEIYTTIIFRNGNGYFLYPPKVGYSFHFHNTWIDIHFSGDTHNETSLSGTTFTRTEDVNTFTFKSGNTLPIGSVLQGAFVEYIPTEMKERIISESIHKFIANPEIFNHEQTSGSTYSGVTENNPIGLYYQPHYRIKLRELSSYVETSNTNNVLNLPNNAKYFSDEKLWKWRDVYDLGYIDEQGNGVDFSYMNDTLYVHNDINFYIRNEKLFKNKTDGIKKFKNITYTSLINC